MPDAGPVAPAPAPAATIKPQRFLEPGVASAWTFPDQAQRRERAQRLATKIGSQLDAEHDRAVTGAGFAFALVVDGEVVLLKAKGVADLENKRVTTPDTIFRVASITKTFTATSVMMIRDQQKLALADPLTQHLPDFDVGYPHRDAQPIRIEHLLTHSAGLVRSGPYAELKRPSTEDDLIDAMKLPLTSDPGLAHKYSNFGFGLLGLLIGRKSGVPYRDFVQTKILEPLSMTSSGFDLTKLPADRLSVGYKHDGPRLSAAPMTTNGAGEGAGGLYSSARDMAEWLRFQLGAWPPRDDPDEGIVKRATLREMHTPRLPFMIGASAIAGGTSRAHVKSIGLGWEITKGCYFDRLVGHDGDIDGFHARLRFDADRGFGFVLLANSDNADVTGVLERLLDTIATEDSLAPRRRDPAPELLSLATNAVKKMGATAWTADEHNATFSEQLRSQFTLGEAVALGPKILKEVGACWFQRTELVTDALDAELLFRCQKGILRASVRATGSPLRLFGFKVDVMKPADDDQLDVARSIVQRMQSKDDNALAKALNSKAVTTTSKILLRAGADAGPCKLEGGDVSPWSRAATFRLSCAKSKNATLRLAQRDSGIVDVVSVDTPTRCLR